MSRTTVLFIDDEENVLNALRRSLRNCDYQLHFVKNPTQALELLSQEPVDIIVSDHLMTGMTGLQLLTFCRERYPDAIRILLTGHADLRTAIAAINQGQVYRLLTKPWDNTELQTTLRLASDKVHTDRENRRLLAALRAGRTTLIP